MSDIEFMHFLIIVSDGDTIDSFLTWSCSLSYNNFVHLTRYVCCYEWEGCWCWTCVLPEEDSGVTGEKQITDLLIQIEKYKSVILFSPVLPESSSGVTRSNNWKRLADKKIEELSAPGQFWSKISISRRTSIFDIFPSLTIIWECRV